MPKVDTKKRTKTSKPLAITLPAASKKTDYVLADAEPGSTFESAKELGVKIIDEAAFRRMT